VPSDLFKGIIDQLTAYRDTLEGIWLHNYNEPTTDKRLVEFVDYVWTAGLKPAMNTNGSGLNRRKVEQLLDVGGLCSLTVNLSTLNAERYMRQRGVDQLGVVLDNLRYLKDVRLAPRMHIVIIGSDDPSDTEDVQEIKKFFEGGCFEVFYYPHNNRAARIRTGRGKNIDEGLLGGCEFLGSRPLQHLTVDAYGRAVICCQDYHSDFIAGDLSKETVDAVLRGAKMAKLRSWTYGLEKSPEDFICRKCAFVLAKPSTNDVEPDDGLVRAELTH